MSLLLLVCRFFLNIVLRWMLFLRRRFDKMIEDINGNKVRELGLGIVVIMMIVFMKF